MNVNRRRMFQRLAQVGAGTVGAALTLSKDWPSFKSNELEAQGGLCYWPDACSPWLWPTVPVLPYPGPPAPGHTNLLNGITLKSWSTNPVWVNNTSNWLKTYFLPSIMPVVRRYHNGTQLSTDLSLFGTDCIWFSNTMSEVGIGNPLLALADSAFINSTVEVTSQNWTGYPQGQPANSYVTLPTLNQSILNASLPTFNAWGFPNANSWLLVNATDPSVGNHSTKSSSGLLDLSLGNLAVILRTIYNDIHFKKPTCADLQRLEDALKVGVIATAVACFFFGVFGLVPAAASTAEITVALGAMLLIDKIILALACKTT